MQAAEDLRQLPVAGHRVGDPRRTDDAGVGRDEEDRRGEHADVDLRGVEQLAFQAEVLDHAEHRIVGEAALLGRQREPRRQLPADLLDRQSRQRHEGEREEDREHRERDELVRVRHVPGRIAHLLGQVGDGLDTRVGEHGDRHGERKVRPGWSHAPVNVVNQRLRTEDQGNTHEHEQDLRGEVDHCERDRELCGFRDANDVERDENDDDDRTAHDVPRVGVERLPEDREVVRDEEGGDRDGDHVDEHLRPRGREGHQLVERVPGEAGGAARLREAHSALAVRRSRAGKDEARHDEDEGRQPKSEDRGEAERVVDRRADVAVRGGEERRRPEDALEFDLPTPAAGHRESLERREAGVSAGLPGRSLVLGRASRRRGSSTAACPPPGCLRPHRSRRSGRGTSFRPSGRSTRA